MIWQLHICLLLSRWGSFEFQFGVEEGNEREGERETCKVAKGKAATSSITHKWESFVSVWGALIQLFSLCLKQSKISIHFSFHHIKKADWDDE